MVADNICPCLCSLEEKVEGILAIGHDCAHHGLGDATGEDLVAGVSRMTWPVVLVMNGDGCRLSGRS